MLNPYDAITLLVGGGIGALIGSEYGNAGRGYLISSVVGGVLTPGVEDFLRNSAPLWHALGRSGIRLGGAAAGGSYLAGGDLESVLFWRSFGGGIAGMLSRLFPCFPAGTPVLTPSGWKPIESLQPGDLVLSRDEQDVTAPVAPKPIQETFVRQGELYALQFTAGGTGWRIRRPGAKRQARYISDSRRPPTAPPPR